MLKVTLCLQVMGTCATVLAMLSAAPARSEDRSPGSAKADLEALSRRSVYFGHQSVGRNILEGLQQLSKREGVPLRIVHAASASAATPGTFAHGEVADNGDPLRKLRSFEAAMAGPTEPDLALVKFCWVDFDDPKNDPALVFDRYQQTLAALEKTHPHTTFVRVTVPLSTVQGGWKASVKKLLGKPLNGLHENARRQAFNELVRRAASDGSAPLFDLARVESTRPDGTAEAVEIDGKPVPALVPAYTRDGGHLVGEGQIRVAAELARVLASAPLRGASAQSAHR